MTTPHINSKINDFSETVVMAGDPFRVQYIAENFLDKIKKINDIRGMLGFSGIYKKKNVSVMSHGIGIPSASIYVQELITNFGVKNILRVGTCCAISEKIKLRDIIIGMGACTDSKVNRIKFNDNDFSAIADYELMQNVIKIAKAKNTNFFVGNLFTTDLFYAKKDKFFNNLEKFKILGIEMETSGIYSIAAEYGIKALTICTVSDHFRYKKKIKPRERQNSLNEMIEIALESTLLI